MENVITLGKRLLPFEQIVLIEPFDPSSNPDFKPAKEFKARVVLLNRDTVLTETTPQEFASAQGFRLLTEDNVAANPAIPFKVESFEPTETFKPTKPYLTRLKWRRHSGLAFLLFRLAGRSQTTLLPAWKVSFHKSATPQRRANTHSRSCRLS
jgi:hypothetical protein